MSDPICLIKDKFTKILYTLLGLHGMAAVENVAVPKQRLYASNCNALRISAVSHMVILQYGHVVRYLELLITLSFLEKSYDS